MPVINNLTTVPANGTVFPLAGSTYEFLQFAANVIFGFAQQTGAYGAVLASISSGSDVLMEEGTIPVRAGNPVFPDDFVAEDQAAVSDRLRIQLRNTTGGAIVVGYTVRIVPMV